MKVHFANIIPPPDLMWEQQCIPTSLRALTQCGEPSSYRGIDFIQDDDDDQVKNGGSSFDCSSDVRACGRVRAHVQCGLNADPVQDDSKDYSKSHSDLI